MSTIKPMLATPYKPAKTYRLPLLAQPKLDGVRCIATRDGLFTRTGKPITGFDHIQAEVNQVLLSRPNIIALDGELYAHRMGFDRISGIVRKGGDEGKTELKLHVFDYVPLSSDASANVRMTYLAMLMAAIETQYLECVNTVRVEFSDQIDGLLNALMKRGYEGIILRTIDGLYTQSRTSALMKYKKFSDAEFKITGFKSGAGKEQGMIIWTCAAGQQTFDVRPQGSYEERRELMHAVLRSPKSYLGKDLTVRYQEMTPNGVPRFPVGIAVRDYE